MTANNATGENFPDRKSYPGYENRDAAQQEWYKAAAAQLSGTDTILCLWIHGATYDGDVPSKRERDELLDLGLCAKVCGKNGAQGFQALTYRGFYVVKALFETRLKDWHQRQEAKKAGRKMVRNIIDGSRP